MATKDDDLSGAEPPIQSLKRAFLILEAVSASPGGVRVADLSKQLRLHNSTVFHLTKSLQILGYLRQNEDDKRYRIGRKVFGLAAGAFDDVELASLATPLLEQLAQKTGETSHLAVRSGLDVLVLARVDGAGAFRMAESVGVRRQAHCTALGKVLLAALKPEQLETCLRNLSFERFTPKTISEPAILRREIEQVRAAGTAFDDGEFHPEVRCLAAPVFGFTGGVVAALGISGPLWRVGLKDVPRMTEQLVAHAKELSRALGYRRLDPEEMPAAKKPVRRRSIPVS